MIENKMLAALAARAAAEMGAEMVPIDITIVIIDVRTLSQISKMDHRTNKSDVV